MSRASKLTLLGTSLFAIGVIAVVHTNQETERLAMHEGVVRDLEKQRIKRERELDFEMQKELEAEYKKEQRVSAVAPGDGGAGGGGGGGKV